MSADREVLRILDVNLNRAREALRVIEDYARFVRDDRDAALAAKSLRHGLRDLVALIGGESSLAARDIESDVGRESKTPAELHRPDAAAVAAAAFGRLTEAARSLGEYGKLAHPDIASSAERLRYAAYGLEQRILLRADRRATMRACRLYVIITESLCRHAWLETAEAALRGGATCIQLREKSMPSANVTHQIKNPRPSRSEYSRAESAHAESVELSERTPIEDRHLNGDLPDRELLFRARTLRELTRRFGALFIVNDRPDIALLAGADGVHVGQDDQSVRDVRRIAGADLLVGKSTHTIEQFDAALAENPDYIAIGPMFHSNTKPQSLIAGPETLAAVAKKTSLPLVAIGGIDASNVARVRASGASCICVCSVVVGSNDPESAARALLDR